VTGDPGWVGRVPAVVLAAGGGSRFAGPSHKLLASRAGRPLVRWAIDAALEAGSGPVWVVAGAVDLSEVVPHGVEILANPRWAQGQATSLDVALETAAVRRVEAVVVGLGDQPLVPASAWRAVAALDAPIVVAAYNGHRRNPVRLRHDVWSLVERTGDQGARGLLRDRPDLVSEVACEGSAADIDTVEDLSQWS
jgi:molybdenum cofactor cytidylyltransferase